VLNINNIKQSIGLYDNPASCTLREMQFLDVRKGTHFASFYVITLSSPLVLRNKRNNAIR